MMSCMRLATGALFPRPGKKKNRDTYRAKTTASVNDRYFVSDVTSYSAGNFTAAPCQNLVSHRQMKGMKGSQIFATPVQLN